MWLVICREYNEDPVFFSLVSPTMFAARRRTIYVFFDRGEEKGIERLALGGGSNGGLYTVYRDTGIEGREIYGEGQWVLLKKLIDERKPSTIAINISHTHAFSDGLSSGEREKLESALGTENLKRIVRAENLALEYIETRLPEMLPTYRQMMETRSLVDRPRVFKRSNHSRQDHESGRRVVAAAASEQPRTRHVVSSFGASSEVVEGRCGSCLPKTLRLSSIAAMCCTLTSE